MNAAVPFLTRKTCEKGVFVGVWGQFALEIVDSGKFIPVPGLPQSTGVKTKLQAAHT